MTDQIRRSSRSVCANLAEAWRKRVYPAAFVAKISDAEAEAGETQTWLELSLSCNYLEAGLQRELINAYEKILGQLVNMRNNPKKMDNILTSPFHPLTPSPSHWIWER